MIDYNLPSPHYIVNGVTMPLNTWPKRDLHRFITGCMVEYQEISRDEQAALLLELRDAEWSDGPYSDLANDDSVEFDFNGNEYTITEYAATERLVDEQIREYATDQADEMDRQLTLAGINTFYISFDIEMFVQDIGYDGWGPWLNSWDSSYAEIFPLCPDHDGILQRGGNAYVIWRTG